MKKFCSLILVLLFFAAEGQCQIAGKNGKPSPVKFEYDANLLFYFNNREFAYSGDRITPSMTDNAVLLTPSVGLSVAQGFKANHRLMLGVDMWRNMGSGQTTDLFREITIFYDAHVNLKKGRFEGLAGVFPRRFMEGDYSEAFYSDSLKFYDPNLDGILLKYRSDSFFAELGCDWMGQAGRERKERFEVYTAGRWNARRWLALGWSVSIYHYAGSELAPGVVDNHKFNPYVLLDGAGITGMQELSLKAGPMLTYQWDRERDDKPAAPLGAEAVLRLRNWNLCVENTSYFGNNLLHYYQNRDLGNNKYGNNLYRGLPFYTGFYDRVELSWNPRITDWLNLNLCARMHFSQSGFLGWQQVLSLRFNLDAVRHHTYRSGTVAPAEKSREFEFGDLLNL